MKKLSMFGIVSIILIFTLSACGIDPIEKFNGRWKISYITVWGQTGPYDDDRFLELNLRKDGTCTLSDDDENVSGNYYIDDEGDAVITFDDDEFTSSFSVDGDSMVWTVDPDDENSLQVYLERVSISS